MIIFRAKKTNKVLGGSVAFIDKTKAFTILFVLSVG